MIVNMTLTHLTEDNHSAHNFNEHSMSFSGIRARFERPLEWRCAPAGTLRVYGHLSLGVGNTRWRCGLSATNDGVRRLTPGGGSPVGILARHTQGADRTLRGCA